MNDFFDQITHLMIDDVWYGGQGPQSSEVGF